jgi:hypothetical protein
MTAISPSQAKERVPATKMWDTGLLRVTAFCLNPPDLGSIRWWDNVVGKPAETRQVRPGLGQLIEQGSFDERSLQLGVNLARVDWIMIPKPSEESETFGSLGNFAQAATTFRELISKWFAEPLSLNRIAFGASLFIHTKDQHEAIQQIKSMLPSLRSDLNEVQDFIFQINRPKPSVALPELGSINRIARWQVVLRQTLVANLLPQVQPPVSTSQQTAANLELDINTPALSDTKKELPREKLSTVLEELSDNALEIALKGDIQ